jgi:hypothetical protein
MVEQKDKEGLFRILIVTYNDDQKKSHDDYILTHSMIELFIQTHFNRQTMCQCLDRGGRGGMGEGVGRLVLV